MTGRPTHGPLPEGSPELHPGAEAVLDPAHAAEVLAAHSERIVVGGVDRRGRPIVVKVERNTERHQREVSVLRTLRSGGVPVPEVLDASRDDAVGAWVLVLERIDGEPLTGADDPARWAAVGSGLAQLHSAVADPTGPPFSGHADGTFADHLQVWTEIERRQGVEEGWMTPAEGERLGILSAAATNRSDDVPQVLLHGDCAPQHWLFGPAPEPRPVDLGDAGVGDPTYDLMVLTLTAPERLGDVLDGYQADDALRDHVAAVVPGYRALRLAGEVSWLREHRFDPSPSLARLSAALA
ncbi:MAG: phosphotransferase family protein [Iamia sp.]